MPGIAFQDDSYLCTSLTADADDDDESLMDPQPNQYVSDSEKEDSNSVEEEEDDQQGGQWPYHLRHWSGGRGNRLIYILHHDFESFFQAEGMRGRVRFGRHSKGETLDKK